MKALLRTYTNSKGWVADQVIEVADDYDFYDGHDGPHNKSRCPAGLRSDQVVRRLPPGHPG